MISKQDYHEHTEYSGFSEIARFIKCEAEAMSKRKMKVTMDMLIGMYVDAYYDKEFRTFEDYYPQIFKKDGELKAPFKKAEDIIEKINKDKVFYELITGERQVIFTGQIVGVDIKIKIDSYFENKMIVDNKVLRDYEDIWLDGEKVGFWNRFRYDIQAYVYSEIVKQNIGKLLPFVLAVATKEEEPDLAVFKFSDEILKKTKKEVLRKLVRMQELKSKIKKPIRCGHCNYCKSTRKIVKDEFEMLS